MKNRLIIVSWLCIWYSLSFGQVIYTEPVFPKADDSVSIFFDASKGTRGLENCNCNVYIHTGVITSESTGPTDWKYVQTQWGQTNPAWVMTKVSDNLYRFDIQPSINEYYGVGADEAIESLAFVFRNGDGSLEGKGDGASDIFYDVYGDDFPFTSLLLSPESSNLIHSVGESIQIKGVASDTAQLQIYEDEMLLYETKGKSLDYELIVKESGSHSVEFVAIHADTTQRHHFNYVTPVVGNIANMPDGTEYGITYLSDTSVLLALYAPHKRNAYVVGDFSDWQLDNAFLMNQSEDGESFWLQINGLNAGEIYRFQYLVDGTIKIADPYSTLVLDPSNDTYISESVYPDLPAYPNGQTTGIVSVIQPGATPYNWATTSYTMPEKEKLVVYELLLRDFVEDHSYKTLLDSLSYFKKLGVNAIELMPVSEFEGNSSWGYNPSFHNALDKYYGTPNDFKTFIDSCHANGIAVILDVVYNHVFSQSPLAQLYWAGSQPSADNPYLNQTARHPFNVGYDVNHESEASQYWVKRVVKHWLEEYKIDGFRFDLSKGFTQRNTPEDVGAWSSYDASRIEIWRIYADAVWDTNPNAYVILEHFGDNTEETILTEYGMLVWGNMNHQYSEAAMSFDNDLTGTDYTSRAWDYPGMITYMESHDEERILYRCLEFGKNTNANHNIRQLPIALKRKELASAFFYTIPGPKMLWQFGELGYDYSINYRGRLGEKPIRWDYLGVPERKHLFDVTSALIDLRNRYEVFHTNDFELSVANSVVKTVKLNSEEMDVMVIGNFDDKERVISVIFQEMGTWYDYFTGDSITIDNRISTFTFAPSEYRLYTNKKIAIPAFVEADVSTSAKDLELVATTAFAYPNPTSGAFKIQLPHRQSWSISIYNSLGQLAYQANQASTNLLSVPIELPKGLYWIKCIDEKGKWTMLSLLVK